MIYLDKYTVGINIGREGMYDDDVRVLETWKDIWELINKVLLDHRKKRTKRDIHEKEDAK